MSQINLNNTTPAAPGGYINVTFQTDASNNISGYVPTASSPAFIGASAYNAGTLTFSAGVQTTLSFDTNSYDTSSIHSTSVNPTRFTAPQTGYYLLTSLVLFSSAPAYCNMGVFVNGSALATPQIYNGLYSSAGNAGPSVSAVVHLTAGDYVEFAVYSANGNTLNAGAAFGQLTALGV